MQNFKKITDFSAPELDIFVRLTGPQLRRLTEAERGIFIAESPTVIDVALNSGCEPIALLTDERLINGAVENIINRLAGIPIYTAEREVLSNLTGFELTRGALCAMKRPEEPPLSELLEKAERIAVLEAVADSTNIGALFRSAAALNVDAVLISPTCCDPLCRRAVRVSMGTVFQVPWARIGSTPADWPRAGMKTLSDFGFKSVAMALRSNTVNIDDESLSKEERLAIILGTEGTGLSAETVELADYTVKIPMSWGVDSLNVAAAGAVAFWELCARGRATRGVWDRIFW